MVDYRPLSKMSEGQKAKVGGGDLKPLYLKRRLQLLQGQAARGAANGAVPMQTVHTIGQPKIFGLSISKLRIDRPVLQFKKIALLIII